MEKMNRFILMCVPAMLMFAPAFAQNCGPMGCFRSGGFSQPSYSYSQPSYSYSASSYYSSQPVAYSSYGSSGSSQSYGSSGSYRSYASYPVETVRVVEKPATVAEEKPSNENGLVRSDGSSYNAAEEIEALKELNELLYDKLEEEKERADSLQQAFDNFKRGVKDSKASPTTRTKSKRYETFAKIVMGQLPEMIDEEGRIAQLE